MFHKTASVSGVLTTDRDGEGDVYMIKVLLFVGNPNFYQLKKQGDVYTKIKKRVLKTSDLPLELIEGDTIECEPGEMVLVETDSGKFLVLPDSILTISGGNDYLYYRQGELIKKLFTV